MMKTYRVTLTGEVHYHGYVEAEDATEAADKALHALAEGQLEMEEPSDDELAINVCAED